MADLAPEHVRALAASLELPLDADDLAEVTHRLNAFRAALEPLGRLPLDAVEPLPIVLLPGETP